MRIDELLEVGDDAATVAAVWRKLIPRGAEVPGLPAPVRTFHAAFELLGEVRNGSFHQYFTNSSGDRAVAALEALRELAVPDAVAATVEAFAVFPGGVVPPDRGDRGAALDSFGSGSYARLEGPSRALADAGEGLLAALARLVASRANEFVFLDRQACGYKYAPARPDATLDDLFETTPSATAFRALEKADARAATEGFAALGPDERALLLVLRTLFLIEEEPGLGAYRGSEVATRHGEVVAAIEALGLPGAAAALEAARRAPSAERGDAFLGHGPEIVAAAGRLARDRKLPLEPVRHWLLVPAFFAHAMRAVQERGEGALGPAGREFLRAFVFADEVSSGGFAQFFLTRTAVRALEIVRFFEAQGCREAGTLLREALAAVGGFCGGDGPTRRRERESRSPEATAALAALDARFQAGVRAKITETLARFLEARRGELLLPL